MVGLGRGWPSGRSRALEKEPIALRRSEARGELTYCETDVRERLGRTRDEEWRTASSCTVRRLHKRETKLGKSLTVAITCHSGELLSAEILAALFSENKAAACA